jgi:uncharacterized protein YlzI (FlbEa/FlbD family)
MALRRRSEMICLHRLRGEEFWLNPDLVVFVESAGHDTVVTLADGNRVAVGEQPSEVAAAVMRFRSSIIAAADELMTMFSSPSSEAGRVVPLKPKNDRFGV